MNDKIEHCLYESGLTAQGCWDELDNYAKQSILIFAELIIRECITVVDECNDVIISKYPNAFGYFVDDDPIANIKEHFGVE